MIPPPQILSGGGFNPPPPASPLEETLVGTYAPRYTYGQYFPDGKFCPYVPIPVYRFCYGQIAWEDGPSPGRATSRAY